MSDDHMLPAPDAYLAELTALRERIAHLEQELETLHTYKERFRIVADFTYDWEYWVDSTGALLYVSPSCERITGYRPDEFQADPGLLEHIIHPDDRDRVAHHLRDEQCSQQVDELAFRIITRRGEERWIGHVCQPVYGVAGDWIGQHVSNRDITLQKQGKESLRIANQQFETLFATMHTLVASMDREFTFLRVNQAYAAADSQSPAFFVGKNYFDLYPHAENEALFRRVVETGEPYTVYAKPCGYPSQPERGITYYDWTLQPIKDTRGSVEGLLLCLVNVTERVEFEEAYHAVVDHSLQALVILQNGRNVFVNPAAEKITGYTQNELLTMSPEELTMLIHPADRALILQRREDRITGKDVPSNYEFRIVCRDGSVRWLETFNTRITYRGKPAIQMSYIDITARKQGEEALRVEHQLAIALSAINDHTTGLNLVLDTVLQLDGIDCGGIYMVDPQSGGLDLVAHRGLSDRFIASASHFDADTPQTALLQQGQAIYQPYSTLAFASEERLKEELRAVALLPIQHDRQLIAGLNLASRTCDKLPEQTRLTLEAIAAQMGSTIVRIVAEAAQRESRRNLQTLFNTLDDLLFIVSMDGTLQHVNPAVERRLGYTLDELRGMHVLNMHPPERHAEATAVFAAMGEGTSVVCLVPLRTRSGDCIPVETRGVIGIWNGEKVVFGISRDISERICAEQALRASEQKFRNIVEQSSDGITLTDEQGIMREWNPAMEHMTGLARTDVVGQPAWDILFRLLPREQQTPEVLARYQESVQQAVTTGQAPWVNRVIDYEVQNPDGTRWYAQQQAFLISVGSSFLLCSIMRDSTERKRAEEALRAREELYRAMFEKNRAVKLLIDPVTYTIVDANPAASEFYGYPLDVLRSMKSTDINMLPAEEVQTEMQRALTEQRTHFLFQHRLASGSIRDVEVYSGPIEVGGQQLLFSIIHDITERKLAETRLQRANTRLAQGLEQLRQHNREAMLLNQMGNLLQECRTMDEAYEVVAIIAETLFANQTGALYLRNTDNSVFEAVAHWGNMPAGETLFLLQSCRSLQLGHTFVSCKASPEGWCQHITTTDQVASLCTPLTARGETIGLLHLRNGPSQDDEVCEHWQHLAEMVARNIAMALINLALRERLLEQAIQDPLTGLHNRRYLDEALPHTLERAAYHQQTVGVIMLDVDHFKYFNDTYGHDAGDTLLRVLGAFLQAHTRDEDIACRYGGEEFLLVLPGASLDNTQQRAEQMRIGIRALNVQHLGRPLEAVTVSLGVAVFPRHGTTASAIIKAADTALYQAKQAGRNRVAVVAHWIEDPTMAEVSTSLEKHA